MALLRVNLSTLTSSPEIEIKRHLIESSALLAYLVSPRNRRRVLAVVENKG